MVHRNDWKVCRDCGVPVADERVHRRWHDNVVVVSERTGPTIRFIGESQPDPNPQPLAKDQ